MAIIYQNNLPGKGYTKYQIWRLLHEVSDLATADYAPTNSVYGVAQLTSWAVRWKMRSRPR